MYTCRKENIYEFLENLKGEVYAPIKLLDGTVTFGRVADGEPVLDNILTIQSFKTVLFPAIEQILGFEENKPVENKKSTEPIYLFGLKSFDTGALKFLDRFFCEGFGICDSYYYERRNRTVVIEVASAKPVEGSFYTPAHTSTISEDGFDIQFIETEDRYLILAETDSGKTIIEANKTFFDDAKENDIELLEKLKSDAAENLKKTAPFEEAISLLLNNDIKDEFWQKVSDSCIECGGCSYSCPTCNCFNIYDLVYSETEKGKSGIRCRSHDSCLFKGFTREASGHNERHEQSKRIRRWFTHKIKADVVNTGQTGCYGCGRCYVVCPGNIGIENVVKKIVNNK